MNDIKVSIIVPVYNTAEFLGATLASLTSQSLREIEIIAVDDGSTDESPEILRRAVAADPRIRVIRQRNGGQSAARNAGLAEACGRYVYFMDSDDLLAPEALERCRTKCESDGLDIVLFDADIFGDAGCFDAGYYRRTDRLEDRVYSGADLFGEMLEKHAFRASVCLYLIRREYLDRTGLRFREGIIHEDELFSLLLCLRAARAGIIREPFFRRRFRKDSTMTARFSMRNMHGYFTVAREALAFARAAGDPEKGLVRRFVRLMLNPAVCKAAWLPARDRARILSECLVRFPGYVKARTAAVLLLKRPLAKFLRG